jgi:hypothetical protein
MLLDAWEFGEERRVCLRGFPTTLEDSQSRSQNPDDMTLYFTGHTNAMIVDAKQGVVVFDQGPQYGIYDQLNPPFLIQFYQLIDRRDDPCPLDCCMRTLLQNQVFPLNTSPVFAT